MLRHNLAGNLAPMMPTSGRATCSSRRVAPTPARYAASVRPSAAFSCRRRRELRRKRAGTTSSPLGALTLQLRLRNPRQAIDARGEQDEGLERPGCRTRRISDRWFRTTFRSAMTRLGEHPIPGGTGTAEAAAPRQTARVAGIRFTFFYVSGS